MRETGAICRIGVLTQKQCIAWDAKRVIFKQLALKKSEGTQKPLLVAGSPLCSAGIERARKCLQG